MNGRSASVVALLALACSSRPSAGGATGTGTTGGGTTDATGVGPSGTTGATGSGSAAVTTADPSAGSTGAGGSTGGCTVGTGGLDLPETCDLWAQDCPCGSKCMAYSIDGGNAWNGAKCVPVVPDPKGLYEPCTVEGNALTGVDDCDYGMMCWDVNPETNMGMCVGMCLGSESNASCADPNAGCTLMADGVAIPCVPFCNPLVPDCPDPADLCLPAPLGGGFICGFDASGDMGVDGDPCEYVNVCKPGLFCANSSELPDCDAPIGCCTPFCDLTDPLGDMQCPGYALGEACVPWYEPGEAPPKLVNVGACILPP